MSNGKVMIIHIIVRLIKKMLLYKNELFSRYSHSKKMEVKLDLSNYATKSSLKTQQVYIHRNLLKKII